MRGPTRSRQTSGPPIAPSPRNESAYEDGSHVKQIAKSVDLIEGYAYLKIEKPVSELEQLTLTAADVMRLTLEDPARFLPAVLQQLRREVRMTDGEFRRLSDHLFESVPRAALSPWTPLVLGCEEPSEPAPWVAGATEAWQRYVRLETSELIREILAGPPDSLEPLAESQVTEVLLLKAASTGVSDFLSLLHLPFILSHRTIGGARGTEVVVYTHNTSPTTADVYYFYLFSKTPDKKVELAAYYLDGGTEKMVGEPFRLEMCQYARVPLELMMYGGEQRWFLTGQNDVEINQINTGLPGNLLDMLNKAYRDACIAGIDPSDVDCNGVNLACLTNEDSSR